MDGGRRENVPHTAGSVSPVKGWGVVRVFFGPTRYSCRSKLYVSKKVAGRLYGKVTRTAYTTPSVLDLDVTWFDRRLGDLIHTHVLVAVESKSPHRFCLALVS